MRKFLVFFMAVFIIIAAGVVAVFVLSDLGNSWQFNTKSESPNKEFMAASYTYNSDTDRQAPYGTYVFLYPSNNTKNPTAGHVVFAGYCENTPSITWLSNSELKMNCKLNKAEGIRTLSSLAYGIAVRFE